MKVSFVCTVRNEENTLPLLLSSLAKQSRFPNEAIFVDGGSTDNTMQILRAFRKKTSAMQVILLQKKGNRSFGRNSGIKQAKGDIVLVSDAGCFLDKDWVKRISEPFARKSLDVVSGYYKPVCDDIFQKCLATYTCVMSDRIDKDNFLPSSRSIAFRKKAWSRVGGYPEYVDTCEDLLFARNLKKEGDTFFFAGDAIVHWIQKRTFYEASRQFYSYAYGDGEAWFIRPQTPFLFLRYIAGFVMLSLFVVSRSSPVGFFIVLLLFLYILWSIEKNYRYVRNVKALYILPMLQLIADIAVISGMTAGFLKSVFQVRDQKMIVRSSL